MKTTLHTLGVALLISLAGPGLAAVTVSATVAAVVAPVAAVLPVATVVREHQAPGPQQPATEVSGGVLIGMAACGLLIVGVAARRRQPGRSVSS